MDQRCKTFSSAIAVWLVWVVWTSALAAAEPSQIVLEASETGGVHRDGTPASVLLHLPQPVARSTPFRVTYEGQPIPAQFRPLAGEGDCDRWWLDFVGRSLPYERRRYVVEYGIGVEPGPEPARGHVLVEKDDAFVISNAPYIDWKVPRDFRGFLRSVDFPPSEHLRPDSEGISLYDVDGGQHRLGGEGTEASVIRQGRLAVALRFSKQETHEALRGVRWMADLTFPGPVSWVELELKVEDPQHRVAELGMHLNLNLNPPTGPQPTLVELGAARTIYRALQGDGEVELLADRSAPASWHVLRGSSGQLRPFVISNESSPPAEGWAHVMDRQRCLAIAFDDFGGPGEDRIRVRGDGRFTASRQIGKVEQVDGRVVLHWRSWLHFVHFPPQYSAATDPYMMQHPLQVRQVK